jgi:8-oxo-dGTP pyrophosphatase MutT (NUDIX family)
MPSDREPPAPTHAGGIVFRRSPEGPQYFLVRPRFPADGWVFPKGHIEPGETPEQAALREVREEAGVRATITALLSPLTFGSSRVQMFLMAFTWPTQETAEREGRWLSLADALTALGFDESRQLLKEADRLVRRSE